VIPGGLSELVFANSKSETPREMARRIRNDPNYKVGLSWTMGDKACDLFAKWAVGSYRLTAGLPCDWTPQDCPIPMDQRIGRLMIRCGFMEEFYGVASEMGIRSHGWTPVNGQNRPANPNSAITPGDWHLTVMDFRKNGRVPAGHRLGARDWIASTTQEFERTFSSVNTGPQDVASLLCRSYSEEFGNELTPVEVDDFFMEIAEEICTDREPKCKVCPIAKVCLANTKPQMIRLKNCYT
jgi:hypothetical protein